MASNGITKEVYSSLEATLKIYQAKVATQGYESLTKEDLTTLKNLGAVARLIRFTALKEIVKNAIEGDYSKVVEYYSQIEKSYLEEITKLQVELDEASAKIVEAISRGDMNGAQQLTSEYDKIKNKIKGKSAEYDNFLNSQLKPEDFVRQILGAESRDLVTAAVREIVYSNGYISQSKSLDGPTTLYSFSRENEVFINDDLVQLTIDYLNGNNEDINNLLTIQILKEQLYQKEKRMNSNLDVMHYTFREYQNLLSQRKIYAEAIENIRFSRSQIHKGELKGHRKYEVEADLTNIDQKIYNLFNKVIAAYNEIVNSLKDKIPNLPKFDEVFSNETNLEQFMELVGNEYKQLIIEGKKASLQQVDEISAKTNPRYLKLNPKDIDRITYYGRGRLETQEFVNMRKNLELLSIVSDTQKGIANPLEIVSVEDIINHQERAKEAIDEVILPKAM